jgi:serine phosphatase RsbU (regulator of sigma subunit)/CHASE2 domain-containing sensor protein
VVLAALLLVALVPELPLLRGLRLSWFDACQFLLPRARASAPALVVEIDDASVARHGQWPWPRTLLADVVERVAAGDPAAIGIDILMPEPDRLSPDRLAAVLPRLPADLAERLAGLESNDAALGRVLRGKPVVLGVAGVRDPPARGAPPLHRAPVRVHGGDPAPFVPRFAAGMRSVDPVTTAAAGHGLLNPISEGRLVRRMPTVALVGDALMPAFDLELLRVASGQPGYAVRLGPRGVTAVSVGDLALRTEPDGSLWIPYSRHEPGRFVPALDVLSGTTPPSTFARKLVIVAVTAVGLGDAHATPVAARMAGAEIHAQFLEGVFDGALLRRPGWARWLELVLLAAGGLLLVWVVPVRAAWLSAVVLGALVALAVGASVVLFRGFNILVDAAVPALALGVVFAVMLGVTLAEADRQRRALRRELRRQREAAARVAGELEAARRIQMGILPDPARAFPGERRFSLYAFLEPAREVGGDLYDFFRLDADRLFFLIADVSGKGVSGSLFAAVSKAISKSTALRRGDTAAMIVREVNAEISRDNPELLFVTAFAGILDAATGRLEYCNAGHEPPVLLGQDGAAPRPLTEGGGPPLCVFDDFAYEVEARNLSPGDTLCLVTDGVTEAADAHARLYGRSRLLVTLGTVAPTAPVEEIGEALRRDVARFAGGAEQADDIAILLVRWNGGNAAGLPRPPA